MHSVLQTSSIKKLIDLVITSANKLLYVCFFPYFCILPVVYLDFFQIQCKKLCHFKIVWKSTELERPKQGTVFAYRPTIRIGTLAPPATTYT